MKLHRDKLLISAVIIIVLVILAAREGRRAPQSGGACCPFMPSLSQLPSNFWTAVDATNRKPAQTTNKSTTNP